jgi:hypothetical protein
MSGCLDRADQKVRGPNASWGTIPTIQIIQGVFGLTLPNAEVFRYKFVL